MFKIEQQLTSNVFIETLITIKHTNIATTPTTQKINFIMPKHKLKSELGSSNETTTKKE